MVGHPFAADGTQPKRDQLVLLLAYKLQTGEISLMTSFRSARYKNNSCARSFRLCTPPALHICYVEAKRRL